MQEEHINYNSIIQMPRVIPHPIYLVGTQEKVATVSYQKHTKELNLQNIPQ